MKLENVKTFEDASTFCDDLITSFDEGKIDKENMWKQLNKYTFHIHDIFWQKAKKEVAVNPKYFDENSNRKKVGLNSGE